MDVINRYNKRLANRQNAETRWQNIQGIHINDPDIEQVEPIVKT